MKPLDKSTWGKLFSSGEIRPQPWIHIKFSTILDEIMSWAALYLLRRIILTESMTVEFIKPVIIGETMEAGGGVLELKGRRDAIIEGVITNSAELDGGQLAAKLNRSFSFYFFLLSFK
jgi:hypothetical protein